ncbi:hypothetical protein [uncultured Ruminococcus sp.]|uniref:hypothetical protein n=1 Tax=uncultured Ruminococcus sp. TaxID=165186 RepID=UPI0025F7319E|nr:hypothetical protein [uncultured Ruminococcus sp.]
MSSANLEDALRTLTERFGQSILDDPKKCKAVMKDLLLKDNDAMMLASHVFDHNYGRLLADASTQTEQQTAVNRLYNELCGTVRLSESAAGEICGAFINGLGWGADNPAAVNKTPSAPAQDTVSAADAGDAVKTAPPPPPPPPADTNTATASNTTAAKTATATKVSAKAKANAGKPSDFNDVWVGLGILGFIAVFILLLIFGGSAVRQWSIALVVNAILSALIIYNSHEGSITEDNQLGAGTLAIVSTVIYMIVYHFLKEAAPIAMFLIGWNITLLHLGEGHFFWFGTDPRSNAGIVMSYISSFLTGRLMILQLFALNTGETDGVQLDLPVVYIVAFILTAVFALLKSTIFTILIDEEKPYTAYHLGTALLSGAGVFLMLNFASACFLPLMITAVLLMIAAVFMMYKSVDTINYSVPSWIFGVLTVILDIAVIVLGVKMA